MTEEFLKEEEKEFQRFYKISSFWVERKSVLKKIALGIFIIVDAVLILFVLWTAIDTYLISYNRERLNVSELAVFGISDLHNYSQSQVAEPVRTGSSGIISLGEGRYDLYSSIKNVNSKWSASVEYSFVSSQGETEVQTSVVLPLEEKTVASFGLDFPAAPRTVKIKIVSVEWSRVDVHQFGFYEDYANERLDFEFNDVTFGSDIGIEGVDVASIGRVSFKVTNNSSFSYYEPSFLIKLLRGNTLVGLRKTTLSEIDSNETVEVDVNWFGQVPDASKVEIVPDINILDLNSYKSLEADLPSDRRDFE